MDRGTPSDPSARTGAAASGAPAAARAKPLSTPPSPAKASAVRAPSGAPPSSSAVRPSVPPITALRASGAPPSTAPSWLPRPSRAPESLVPQRIVPVGEFTPSAPERDSGGRAASEPPKEGAKEAGATGVPPRPRARATTPPGGARPGPAPKVDGDPDDLLAGWDDVTPAAGATSAAPAAAKLDVAGPAPVASSVDAALEALLEPSGARVAGRHASEPAPGVARREPAPADAGREGSGRGGTFDLAGAMASRPPGAGRGAVAAPATAPVVGEPREPRPSAVTPAVVSARSMPEGVASAPPPDAPGAAAPVPARPPDSHRAQVPAHALPRAQGIVEEEASVVIAVDAVSPSAPTAPAAVELEEAMPIAGSPWWWEHRLVVGLGVLAIVALLVAAARVTLFAPLPVAVELPLPAPSAAPSRGPGSDEAAVDTTTEAAAAADTTPPAATGADATTAAGTGEDATTAAAEPSASSSAGVAEEPPEPRVKKPTRRPSRRPAAPGPAATPPAAATADSVDPPSGSRGSPIERDSPF